MACPSAVPESPYNKIARCGADVISLRNWMNVNAVELVAKLRKFFVD